MYVGRKKQSKGNIIKNIRNLFKLKKENDAIKVVMFIDVMTLFKQEEDYYKPIRAGNFWNNSYFK